MTSGIAVPQPPRARLKASSMPAGVVCTSRNCAPGTTAATVYRSREVSVVGVIADRSRYTVTTGTG